MNTRVALGVIVAIVVIVLGSFFLHPTPASAPVSVLNQNLTASTTPRVIQPQQVTGKRTQSSSNVGTTSVMTVTASIALFDSTSFVSTSTYPTITGIANTSKVGIIVNDNKGKGIVGTSEIPVTNGRWSYSCSAALAPGTYAVVLFVDKSITEVAELTVNKP